MSAVSPRIPDIPPVDVGPPEPPCQESSRVGAQVGWTATGLIALFLLVFVAHWTEVAFDCTLYGIYESNGTAGGCPLDSWPTLVMLGGFAVPSSMVAIGLSRNLVLLVSSNRESSRTHGPGIGTRKPILDFAGPFSAFFGWGVLAWGLMEPIAENCIEPCGYPYFPYVLQGVGFELSVLGVTSLAVGASLLALVARQGRRLGAAGSK